MGLGALAGLALALRLWQPHAAPPGLHFDEAANGLIAASILRGDLRLFYSEFNGREALYHYLVAAAQVWLGHSAQAVRLPAALAGAGTALAAYWAFKELFRFGTGAGAVGAARARRSERIAWLTALAITCCYWSLHTSRLGYRVNLVPLAASLAVPAAWRAARTRSLGWALAAGALAGGSLYTYLAARFVPLIFAAFAVYLALRRLALWRRQPHEARPRAFQAEAERTTEAPRHGDHSGSGSPCLRGARLPREHSNRGWVTLGLAWAGAAALAALPLAAYFLFHRGDLVERTSQVSALGSGPGSLLANLRAAAGMFTIEGTHDLKYSLPARPVFDPLNGIVFYGGLASCVLRGWRRPAYAFVLVWLAVMLLPGVLSTEGNHAFRTYGALPAAMGVWAIGAHEAWQFVDGRLRAVRQWVTPGLALAALLLGVMLARTIHDYFGRWARVPELYAALDGDFVDLAAYLRRHPPPPGRARTIASPYLHHPTVAYLAPASREDHWVDVAQALVVPPGATRLEYLVLERVAAEQRVPPDWYTPLGVEPARREPITTEQGRVLGYRYAFDLPQPLTPDRLPLTARACGDSGVTFAHGVTLLGYRLAGPRTAGEPLALTLYWRALPAKLAPRPTSQVFVHLVDEPVAGRIWAQQDANGAFSRGWRAGDLIVGRYSLSLDPAQPPGDYLLAVGLYDLDDRRYPRAPIVAAGEGGGCADLNAARTAYLIRGVTLPG